MRYEIPPYQREYQWGPDQWQAIWRDLGALYERHMAGETSFPNHFLGIMLLEPQEALSIAGTTRYSVIDGQQRLTTLLVLQAAIRDADNEAAGVPLPEKHALFWVRDANNIVEGPRVTAQEVDHPILARAMENDWRAWYQTIRRTGQLEDARALWAYTYFRFCIWRGRLSFISDEERLPAYRAADAQSGKRAEEVWAAAGHVEAIGGDSLVLPTLNSLLQRLDVLELRLQHSDEDAPTIFESINAKRTELEQWDFIRNLIFTRLDRGQAAALFNESWKDVQAELAKVKWDGKRADSRDAFVYDYVIARGEQQHQQSIGRNRGYQHLRRRMTRLLPATGTPEHKPKLIDFVNLDLLSAARAWPAAVGARTQVLGSSRVLPNRALELVEAVAKLSSGPPFPVVLHYVEAWDAGQLDDDSLIEALAVLERYLVRVVLCKRALSPLRAQFMQVMNRVSASVDPELLADELRGGLEPTDDELRQALLTGSYYKAGISGPQLGAVFRGIERQLAGAAAHPLPYGGADDDFTVEHVFPQSCTEPPHGAWGPELTSWKADTQAVAERVDRLGNLTLLTFRANRYLRAQAFEHKQRVFANQDLACPHPLLSVSDSIRNAERWTDVEIDARTEQLASLVLTRWPAL